MTPKTHVIMHEDTDRVKACLAVKEVDLSKPHKVTIEEYKPNKTLEQNNTYWQWVKDIGDHLGNFKYDQDFDLRWMHLPPIYRKIGNVSVETRKTISQLKVNEMREYMDRVSTWAGSENIYIRMPGDIHAHS